MQRHLQETNGAPTLTYYVASTPRANLQRACSTINGAPLRRGLRVRPPSLTHVAWPCSVRIPACVGERVRVRVRVCACAGGDVELTLVLLAGSFAQSALSDRVTSGNITVDSSKMQAVSCYAHCVTWRRAHLTRRRPGFAARR